MKKDAFYQERRRDLQEAVRAIELRHQTLGDCHFCGWHRTQACATSTTAQGRELVPVCDLCLCIGHGGKFGDLTRKFEHEHPACTI